MCNSNVLVVQCDDLIFVYIVMTAAVRLVNVCHLIG